MTRRDPVPVGRVVRAVVGAIAPAVLEQLERGPRLCPACSSAGRPAIALRESWTPGELRCIWCGHVEAR